MDQLLLKLNQLMKSINARTGMSDERALTLKLRSSVSSTTSLKIFLGSPTNKK